MDEAVVKKTQPNSLEAEQALIGAMLMDRNSIVDAADILTRDDFYYSQYGYLFEAMVALYNEGKSVDLVIVSNKLKEMGVPENIWSMDYISDILGMQVTSVYAKDYARIVHEKSIMRKLLRFSEKMVEDCYAGKTNVEDLLRDSEEKLSGISQSHTVGDDYTPIKEIALNVLDTVEASSKRNSKITGIPTGFDDLDEKLTGLHSSELILIAARPAMGKTAFALNIAQYAAMKADVPCAIFSLEMDKEQLVSRLIAMDSLVDSQTIRIGQLADSDWAKFMDSTVRVGNTPMYIFDKAGVTVSEVASRCRKLKQSNGLGLIIIDYLQLMRGTGHRESRQQEISEISRSLKELARELEVPVVALSQLNRAVDSRDDHKPVLSDLRESGAIEQDADVIMFIYRDDYYNKESSKPGIADIIVAKQRNGSTGTIELVWLGKYTKFGNKERRAKH